MKITIEGTEQEIKISSQLSEVVKRIKTNFCKIRRWFYKSSKYRGNYLDISAFLKSSLIK